MTHEIYLHGQILGTHSFLLKGEFLQPDEYSEIKAKYFLPGGETGTAATVLSSLGAKVKIDGTHIGTEVAPLIKDFYKDKSVDLSSIFFDPDYEGLMDYVVIAGLVRSPMGIFQALYEPGAKIRWNMPKEQDIVDCQVAGIDPYFMDATQKTAELCVKHGKPFVTIDSPHDSYLHQYCAVNVVSKECTQSEQYKDKNIEEVYELLTSTTDGLVIITRGEKDMVFGRKGQEPKYMTPFSVEVKSTLGAGDTFKAGCLYALLKGMSDEDLVRFASACSAIAISRFPLPLNPPTMEEVKALMGKKAEFSDLLGKTLTKIIGCKEDSEDIVFITSDDCKYRMYHKQECCEEVRVNDVIGNVDDLIGTPLTMCEVVTEEGCRGICDYYTWSFYKMATVKGYITIRWLGESDGYYSETVDIERIL